MNQKIAVLATETTIASNAYQNLILNTLPSSEISARACSLLVALAEEGMVDNSIAREALKHYLVNITNEDTILLGCTHFPVFKSLLSTMLSPNVKIVDSALATADALYELLKTANLLTNSAVKIAENQYLVTDSIERFKKVGPIFLNQGLENASVELVDIKPG